MNRVRTECEQSVGRAWIVCGQSVGSRKGGKMVKKEVKGQKRSEMARRGGEGGV